MHLPDFIYKRGIITGVSFLFLYMKNICIYIIEKLKINKNVTSVAEKMNKQLDLIMSIVGWKVYEEYRDEIKGIISDWIEINKVKDIYIYLPKEAVNYYPKDVIFNVKDNGTTQFSQKEFKDIKESLKIDQKIYTQRINKNGNNSHYFRIFASTNGLSIDTDLFDCIIKKIK